MSEKVTREDTLYLLRVMADCIADCHDYFGTVHSYIHSLETELAEAKEALKKAKLEGKREGFAAARERVVFGECGEHGMGNKHETVEDYLRTLEGEK